MSLGRPPRHSGSWVRTQGKLHYVYTRASRASPPSFRPALCSCSGPTQRRPDRAGSGGQARNHPEQPGQLGSGPHRSAQPAAQPLLHLQPDRCRGALLRHRYRHEPHAQRSGRSRGQRVRCGHDRRQRRRLQRSRHSYRDDSGGHRLRRGQRGHGAPGPGARLRRLRHHRRRHRRHRLGDQRITRPRPWRT